MVASVPVVEERPSALDRAMIAAIETPTPMMAVSRGSPAAVSEPKVMIRTAAAMAIPIASAEPPAEGWVASAVPPASTVRPDFLACAMASFSAFLLASVRSSAFTL